MQTVATIYFFAGVDNGADSYCRRRRHRRQGFIFYFFFLFYLFFFFPSVVAAVAAVTKGFLGKNIFLILIFLPHSEQ